MIFDLADLIETHINDETYSHSFTAEAKFPTEKKLEEIRELTVRIIPTDMATSNFTRSSTRNAMAVQISIQKHLDGDIDEKIREMHKLVVEIQESLIRKNMPGYCYVSSTINPIYNVAHLMQNRVFSSAITLNYIRDYNF